MAAEDLQEQLAGTHIWEQDTSIKQSAANVLKDRDERRHSREDALSARQFEKLVHATYSMKESQALEGRTALYLTGRLGLRGGEAAHFTEEWVNWQDKKIEIPEHDPCDKGKFEGEICGYCRRRALERVKANNISIEEGIAAIREFFGDDRLRSMDDEELHRQAIALRKEVNITFAEARAERWEPKTPQSARSIPFDFDARIPLTLEAFFDEFDGWEKSKATLNRRINRIAEIADLETNVYPHSLRATSASAHAARNISPTSLMNTLGWKSISTARMYIRSNDQQAANEIRSKHR